MDTQGFNFYEEKKYCPACAKYVHFLQNVHHSYCVDCGTVVHLMSAEEFAKLNAALAERKTPLRKRAPRRKTS
ncbi:MAG: hypothetical protein JNM84_20985 [Planctomycetes bacterium]|nr:hypothetical protein [Planctomycetota bacterium]